MKFEYKKNLAWPPLSWLAVLTEGSEVVTVFHGSQIEIKGFWFCEAVWAGDYYKGNFDKTDIVAGTGGRLRDGVIKFISSGSNVDRLNHAKIDSITFLSNSLVCLLAWIDGDLLYDYCEYGKDFAKYMSTILGSHTHSIPSDKGVISLTYYADLVWDGRILQEKEKVCGDRSFSAFDDYHQFLLSCMKAILNNATESGREHTYKAVCGLSNGYDSPTIAALARAVGEIETFSFVKNRDGLDDSGKVIASILGLPCYQVDPDEWKTTELPEVPFISCSGSVGDISFKSAEEYLNGRLLLSGPSGDTVWDKKTSYSQNMSIGDGSMLGFTEYRLWTGFINCAVPLWGVGQLSDIIRINKSNEMAEWDVGGNYTRPICRRIVESSGVPRSSFGIGKRGVSVVPRVRGKMLSHQSLTDYFYWLDEKHKEMSSKGVPFPAPALARSLDMIVSMLANSIWLLSKIARRRGLRWSIRYVSAMQKWVSQPFYHHRYVIHWAVSRAKNRYVNAEMSNEINCKYSEMQRNSG